MILKRGTYPGASEFAYFDKDLNSMSGDTARSLLEFILHEAHPGMDNWEIIFAALERAEQKAREQGVPI
jgi:hypothetical protein